MKRVLTILAILLLPLSVWAMTPVSDSDLSNVTGQAGVNINVDLTMDIEIGTMAWGDADGVQGPYAGNWNTVAAGGYVGVSNFNINDLKIRARTDSNDVFNTYNHVLMLKPLTIDVATGDKSAEGGDSSTTFVRFGLGSLMIEMDAMQFDVSLWERLGTAGTNDIDFDEEQIMGVVSMGAMKVYISPISYVDIFAHAGMGVSFDVNVTIDRVSMGYMSWGDSDGAGAGVGSAAGDTGKDWFASGTTAGYIGLNDFNLGDAYNPAIVVEGTVAIDVLTSDHGIYATLPKLSNAISSTLRGLGIEVKGDYAIGAKALYYGSRFAKLYVATSGDTSAVYSALIGTFGMEASYFPYAAAVGAEIGEAEEDGYAEKVTVVRISFPEASGFMVDVAQITANVALGDFYDFRTTTGEPNQPGILGDIYIEGMKMTIAQDSWIDIWAH